jgi:hypothetical protein
MNKINNMGSKKDLIPALVGFGISLIGIYIVVRVASGAWSAGQK